MQSSLRDDLQLVVMSATLDADALIGLLPDAVFVESEGRSYPVDCRYVPLKANEYLTTAVTRQVIKAINEESGSILVFLPGMALIKKIAAMLETLPQHIDVLSLYGQMDLRQQQKALAPPEAGRRKIVLTTNIAETSLTIEGIRIVIDAGLEKVPQFDLKTGITRLEQQWISRSSAEQRAGRAGRLEPGICVRLYSESQFNQQPAVPEPEIKRSDLLSLAFELAQWGVREPEELPWLDVPPKSALTQAHELLVTLGLVDQKMQMTAHGRQAYALGTEPRLAAMLVRAGDMDNSWKSSACAAVCLVEEPQKNERNLQRSLHAWKNRHHPQQKVLDKRAQHLARLLESDYLPELVDESKVACVLAIAYPDRIGLARGDSAQYILSNGHGAQLFSDDIFSKLIIAPGLMRHNTMNSQVELAADLDIQLVREQLPFLLEQQEWADWDDKQGKLVAEERLCLGQIILERKPLPAPDKEKMTEALLNYVRRRGLSVLHWSKEDQMFIERVLCAAEWLPELNWPAMDDIALLNHLDDWLMPYMNGITSLKALQKLSLMAALQAYVGWELCNRLDKELPKIFQLPTGNRKQIQYQLNQPPVLSVRIQEVFGMVSSPEIAMGKVKLVLELLSPAQRPIQVTQDLQAFWQGSYKEVQKEMKGRYPKHPWPDDPQNHVATTKTKRQLNS